MYRGVCGFFPSNFGAHENLWACAEVVVLVKEEHCTGRMGCRTGNLFQNSLYREVSGGLSRPTYMQIAYVYV